MKHKPLSDIGNPSGSQLEKQSSTLCRGANCQNYFRPKRTNHIFCSSKCRINHNAKHNNKYKKHCAKCKLEFYADKTSRKFCSRSCFVSYNNLQRAKPKVCKNCDSSFTGDSRRKYCSIDCFQDARKNIKIEGWLNGKIDASIHNGELSKWARNYLLTIADNSCSKCKWNIPNPITKKPILTINHIDGNWTNNKFENLEVLCYNCHTLTETFGSLNTGSISGRRSYGKSRRF